MTWMQFVSEMTKALAWPVALVVVLVAFRRQIAGWMKTTPSKIKAGIFEVEFGKQLSEAEAEMVPPIEVPVTAAPALATGHSTLPPLSTSGTATTGILYDSGGSLVQQFALSAVTSPITAISGAAMLVFHRLLRILEVAGHQAEPSTGLTTLGRRAADLGVIPADAAQALSKLATIQRLALKGQDLVTPAQAMDFLHLAEAAMSAIRRQTKPEA